MYKKIIQMNTNVVKLGLVLSISLFFIMPNGLTQFTTDESTKSISVSYSFSEPVIETRLIQDIIYTDVTIPDILTDGNPGKPCLPVKGAYILLPPKTTVDAITITYNDQKMYFLDHLILPGEVPIPISEPERRIPLFTDENIYSSIAEFPGTLYDIVGTYQSHGYTILVLNIYPVQYQPMNNCILFYRDIAFEIYTKDVSEINEMIRDTDSDRSNVLRIVDNPDDISLYDSFILTSSDLEDSAELLIITTDELKDTFLPLKNAHDAEGIQTKIATLSDIGSDDPEDIREYIREMYQTQGINYVLLGGDDDVIPARHLFVSGMDEDVTYYETYMPSDLYYACLDGGFDGDGDGSWGEPNDGDNGGDVDLFSEVSVGRASVSNVEEAEIFVQKTLSFMADIDEFYRDKVLFVGENLGNYGIATYAGNYLDQFYNVSNDDGYTTYGFSTDLYDITTLYDRDGPWSKEELAGYINDGVGIINHLGHSNYVYNMKMRYSEMDIFNNDDLCFVYSQGCMAGGFDEKDCFAEYMTVKQPYGAAAGIWNARYGWFWAYRTDGDSQRYHREFWDAVFGENIPTIGQANHDSKEDNIYLIGRSCMRWTMYELNLFGDPTLAFYHYRPEKPQTPQGPNSGSPGEQYEYNTLSTDPNDDALYYQWRNDDTLISEWLGPYDSGETSSFTMTWETQGTYSLQVRVQDENGFTSSWSDPLEVTMPKTKISLIERLFPLLSEKISDIFNIDFCYLLLT